MAAEKLHQCVVLAGGLGTRMRPHTEIRPKSLIEVHGRPFLHYQLEWLARQGISEVVLSIGYRGELIREFAGDGSRWGLRVQFVDEGEQLRGTAGALRLALDAGVLAENFVLLYGDSFLRVDLQQMWQSWRQSGAPALMAILANGGKWDRSNVVYENGKIVVYDKTGRDPRSPQMRHIDYGASVFTRALIASEIPAGAVADLAPLCHRLSLDGRLAGFEVSERFYEIGSPEGLRDFEEFLVKQSSTSEPFISEGHAPAVLRNRHHAETGILGGGLAGLTVAAHLDRDCEVLEHDSRPGGHCRSVQEDGFTFDAGGPHIMFSRNQETLDYMVSLLGGNIHRSRRNNKIFYKDRYVKYPFENGLYDLEPQDRYECLYHYIHNHHPAPGNFKEWMYRTFGTGLTEKYLLPYNEKIWNVPADQMSFDWVEGRVPKPPVEDIIKAAVGVSTEGYTHQLYFFYPEQGGIEALPRGMARKVANVKTEFPIRSIRRVKDGWLASDGRQERSYQRIVSTIPLHEMIHAVEGVPEDVKRCVQSLRYNSLFTVSIGMASERLPDYTAIYVPEPGLPFHRLSFPAIFSPHNVPAGRSMVQAEITANAGDGFWELSDAEVLARVVSGLESMNLVKPSEICYSKVVRTEYGYVVQDFNYRKHLDQAKTYFEGRGISLCGRGAEFEYINMDQCIERGIKLATRLRQQSPAQKLEEVFA